MKRLSILFSFSILLPAGSYTLVSCAQKNAAMNDQLPISKERSADMNFLLAEGICNPDDMNKPEIRLAWPATKSILSKQRIDFTIFKDGFETGLFGSLHSFSREKAEITLKVEKGKLEADNLRPLRSIQLKSMSAFSSVAEASEQPGTQQELKKDESISLLSLHQFEPGINYYFRLLTLRGEEWIPGETVRILTPVCPLDEFLKD